MDVPGEGEIRRFLSERIASRCGEQVDPDRPLEEYGLSSRDAVAVAGELADLLGRELSPTLVWEYPTVNRLARALAPAAVPDPVAVPGVAGEPVAVVGMGCRFPGAHGPEAYWKLLAEAVDAVGEVPAGRWEAFDDGSARTEEVLARTTRYGGFLDDVAGFDAEFFGIAPGEAAAMDPQQRLLLETAWEALEHGGIAPRSLAGTRTGTFVGISSAEYAYLTGSDLSAVDAWTATGAAFSIAANRLSYLLDLRGPSMAVDTACSSSLVAAHLAVNGLRSGECDLALAAGVNLLLSPLITVAFDRGGGTAADGRCKAFDASADGMVRAEGCGVVVLKRLSDAERDGDRVLAVIRASAVNQDGRSNGLVAPNPEAQEALLRQVYGPLDRGPDYIEAHGTGTFLGDPIEARAIAAAISTPVLLGSAKTNVGHLEAAAGVAGLIKTVLALHHALIPPTLHFRHPNPHIPWDTLQVVTAPTPWPRRNARAGVSSFGFGGTNAHIALDAYVPGMSPAVGTPASISGKGRLSAGPGEGPPPDLVVVPAQRRVPPDEQTASWDPPEPRPAPPPVDDARHVFVITDISAERVRDHARVLAAWHSSANLKDIAHTLARRAGRGRVAAAVVAGDRAELTRKLETVHPAPAHPAPSGPVWVFGGYGSQWPSMGRHLYRTEPAYRHTIDTLAPMLKAEAGIDLHAPDPKGVAAAQPVIFAVQLALAALWRAYGFEPAAVIGHSMGEVAAAVVSGGLGLPDAVRVICARARLLGTLGGGGAMAVLEVNAAEVPSDLYVAVYSSPAQTVVTGDPHRVARYVAEVRERGLFARTLTSEGAGHSPQVKPLLPRIRDALAGIAQGKPALPYYSTVFDDPRESPTFEAAYWAAGVRRPVRLMQAVQAAAEDGFTVFTELSPHPLLGNALRDTLPASALITHSTERGHDAAFHTQLAITATAMTPSTTGKIVDVPLAPWRHERHWAAPRRRPSGHRLLGAHVETPAGHAWTTTLDDLADAPWRLHPDEWHRHGHPVLPLAAVARLARAAATEVYSETDLYDITLKALLPLPAQVTITLAGTRIELTAKNAAGAWTVYGTAGLTPSPEEAGDLTEVPVSLDAKLVTRAWAPTPPPERGPSRAWLVLAEEGDTRAARLRALLDTAGPANATLVLVPRDLDPAGTRRTILQVAALAARGSMITIATERAQSVRDGEPSDPGPAALRALIRVLAFEHPEAHATLVDFDHLGDLVKELAGELPDDEVAWRDGVRHVARLRRTALRAGVREVAGPGAYVITGGYGRLGRIAAGWLAARGATRIVLNGRSPAPPDGVTQVVAGDLAAPGTAERLVAAATQGGVRLRGVIHAAGVLDDRLIADLDPAGLERVWSAKVTGAQRLHDATKHLELDWWVAFSSAAGLLGSPGQAAYATANAWLDALCERRRSDGLPAISINWGPWSGTAAAMPAVEPLTREEGVEALEALIQRDLSAGVIKLNQSQAVTIFPAIARMSYFSEVLDIAPSSAQDLAGLPPARALAVVTGKVRERAAAVLGSDPVWLDESTVLTGHGLDSLAATRLRGTIEYDFGVTVPMAPLLQGGTLGDLARAVAAGLGLVEPVEPVESAPPVPAVGPRDAAERQVVRVLTGLLGRAPSVREHVGPDLLPLALDLLSRESGGPVRTRGTTVAEIADAIRQAEEAEAERGVIRPLTSGRKGRPIFLAHPAGGTTGVYALLAARLPVPVLGLERLDDAETLGIPERAARYAEAIKETGGGPYRLGGWSFGGLLAFEIARRLEDVELVAMIDSGLPEQVTEAARHDIHARRYMDFSQYLRETYGVDVRLDLAELLALDEPGQLALAEARIAESGVLGRLSPAVLRHQITSHEDTRAIERYLPGPYQGRVVLYRSTQPTPWAVEDVRYAHEDDPARGFGPYSADLEIVEIPGSHHLNLLDPPHVEVIAEHLKGLL